MSFKQVIKKSSVSVLVAFLLIGTTSASAQTLAQSPLTSALNIDSNVLLILDDSLSMRHILRSPGYDQNATYENWQFGIAAGSNTNFLRIDEFNAKTPLPLTCTGPPEPLKRWIQGTFAGETKCLQVPIIDDATIYRNDYMQYLFETYPTARDPADRDLTDNDEIPKQDRQVTLQQVASGLVNNPAYSNVRWCISELVQLNSSGILAECGATTAELEAAIKTTYDIYGSSTPLAETLYEATRYFRGLDDYTSPITHRCQENHAVVITDGLPNRDFDVPYTPQSTTNITNDTKAHHNLVPSTTTLPDWDGLDPATTRDDRNNGTVPRYSDGYGRKTSRGLVGVGLADAHLTGSSLYLDDLALFANEIDFFRGDTDNRTDDAGEPWGDATISTDDFAHQNLITHTVGLSLQEENQMLIDAAQYGGGLSIEADNQEGLNLAFAGILDTVGAIVGTATTPTTTNSLLSNTTNTNVFQVKYDTADWSGELIARSLDNNPENDTFGQASTTPLWTTHDTFKNNRNTPNITISRNLMSVNSHSGDAISLTWANLSAPQQALLNGASGDGENRLNYVLGNQSMEKQHGGSYRNRKYLLGDIVHSAPVYVKDTDFGYPQASYREYLADPIVTKRTPMLYVGANDGFLHGFDAKTGKEKFAFMPQSVYPFLRDLANSQYIHHYFVDGKSIVVDSQLKDATESSGLKWQTILVSSMGAGAKGLFGLNVSDPSQFDDIAKHKDDIYLWEARRTGIYSNHALGRVASQSTNSGDAANANDGNPATPARTAAETDPWWQVDLGASIYIDSINIHNGNAGASVFVSETPFNSTWDFLNTQAQAGVDEFPQLNAANNPTTIDIGGVKARYVRLQLSGTAQQLITGEVEVFGSATKPDYNDIGHIVERPSVIRVNRTDIDPKLTTAWYAITGNGVHSGAGKAVVYVIDLTTGAEVQAITLDDSGDNGIVSNTVIDLDGDDFADRIYLTDLKGNLWRLDWNSTTNEFVSPYRDGVALTDKPVPFFTATQTGTTPETQIPQPITTAVDVIRSPGNREALMIYFGSGKYYDTQDNQTSANSLVRSFYGVLDRGGVSPFTTLKKTTLVSQTITEGTLGSDSVRVMSSHPVDLSQHDGWYIDLQPDNAGDPTGEKVIYEPLVFRDRVLFATIIPHPPNASLDLCAPEVSGWLMQVDAATGGEPRSIVFDVNRDGNFDSSDLLIANGASSIISGIHSPGGAPSIPSIVRLNPGEGQESTFKGILSDTSGNLQEFQSSAPVIRTSWRRLN